MDQTRRFKVNLWGYIGAKDCGLVDIEGGIEGKNKGKQTSKSYLKLLQDVKIEQIADRTKKIVSTRKVLV